MVSERNWDADWAMCEKATPGPYAVTGGGYRPYAIYTAEDAAKKNAYDHAPRGHKPEYPRITQLAAVWDHNKNARNNAGFFAEARSALPFWLLRVKELEAENARLRAVAEAAEKLYALHDGDLEVDDLQKSQEHMDAEEALFDLLAKMETEQGVRLCSTSSSTPPST